jgi:acylphosphatase
LTKIHLRIRGKVQGVFYRQSARELSKLLGLFGWIKNNLDGTVETVAIGEDQAIDRFLDWCKIGPNRSIVEEVVVISRNQIEEIADPELQGGFRVTG